MLWKFGDTPDDFPEIFSRTVDLTGTEPTTESFRLGDSGNDYIIENLYIQYPEVAPAPSTFVFPSLSLTDLSSGTVYLNNINVIGFTSPGMFFPGTSGNRTNQQQLNAMPLNFFIEARSAFIIEFRNYSGAGNPGTLDIVIFGRRLRPAFFKADRAA